jgi:hypothetical protein
MDSFTVFLSSLTMIHLAMKVFCDHITALTAIMKVMMLMIKQVSVN